MIQGVKATENNLLIFIYDLREVHLLQGIALGIFALKKKKKKKRFCLIPFSFSNKLIDCACFKLTHGHIKCSNEIQNSYKQLNWALSAGSLQYVSWQEKILRDLKDAAIAPESVFHMLGVTKRTSLTQL